MLVPFPSESEIEQKMIGNCYPINLIDALIKECDDLDMTVFADRCNEEEQQIYKDVKIKRLYRVGKLNPFKLFKEIAKLRPDFVHIQYVLGAKFGKGLYLISPFLLMLFLRIARYPLLITIHNIIPLDKLSSTFKGMFREKNPVAPFIYDLGYRLVTTFMGKIASKIIVLDEGTKRWGIEQYGYSKNKIKLIPHGMLDASGNIAVEEAKKALNINKKWNVLLFFGGIHPRKGIEYAIKALPYVLKKHPNTKLLIAGSHSGTWEKEIRSYLFSLKKMTKSLGMENHTLFEIKFFGEEIPIIFNAADVIVLPYVVPYGASGVIKLAATYKRPVITAYSVSREGEITDGISGVLLPSLNEKILAQKINQLLEDKSLSLDMGERFYEKNISSSEWRKVAEETLEYYKMPELKRKFSGKDGASNSFV